MPGGWLVGPTYTSQSKAFDGERAINVYPEVLASGAHARNGMYLAATPGLKLFTTIPFGPIRCLWAGDNRLFAVAGTKLVEVFPDGHQVTFGDVGVAQTPAQIFSNGNELFVVSGAQGYLFDPAVGTGGIPVVAADQGAYLDGYFIAKQPGTNQFNISGLLDGSTWNPLDFGLKIGGPDRLAAIFSDHEELWLIGFRTTEVWYNSGAANFPFNKIVGAFVEQGCIAPYSVAKLDNSMFWLGGDDRGAGVVWRMQGYTPIRISNHAVEYAIQRYPIITDAIAVTRQYLGHSFYEIHFPSADACWVYDVASNMWHERLRWDDVGNRWHEHVGRYHAYVNFPGNAIGSLGQHMVGDWRNGNIYIESTDNLANATGLDIHGVPNGGIEPIRWLRSSPHVTDDLKWTFYEQLQIDMQVGGSATINEPFRNTGGNPQVMLRVSDDGGFTWSNERWQSAGKLGQYSYRVVYRQLGRSRDRAFELSGTDPIQVALIDAYLRSYPAGLTPQGQVQRAA